MKLSRWLIATLLAVTLAACGARDPAAVGVAGNPVILLLSPSHDPGTAGVAELREALSREAGMPVEVVVAPSTHAAVKRMGTPRFDAAILPLFDYLFAHQELGASASLQVLRSGGARTYRGEILVRADGPVQTLADLAGRSIAYVDPWSTSGFLFPASLLADAKVSARAVFTGSHDASLDELRAGHVDAAAVFAGASHGDLSLRAIARTDEIPNEPVVFRSDLAPATRKRLTDALLHLAKTEQGRTLLFAMAEIEGFVEVDDARFAPAHRAIQAADVQVEDLVPDGWRLRHELRGSLLGDFAL
ncbi:MAG: phosphate/phosphite/phosphonate ABC transporter substrate-binding protein [Deltaproteobacteria bacterium]|nr:MAG: phosphate/phosphite/phosphonate ABC transporter substrate-binding protein [Deltaproteobacteria bacterium]